jgi:hypothetical protein
MIWADMGETSPGVLFKILPKQSSKSMREANRETQGDEVKIRFFRGRQNSRIFISRAFKGQRQPSRGLAFIALILTMKTISNPRSTVTNPHTY